MPALFGGILVSHALHLRLALGHWPARSDDYPPERVARMLLDIHELGLVVPGIYATLLAIPLWVLAAILARSRLTGRTVGRQAMLFLMAIGVLYGIGYLLWKPYLNWLAD